MLSYPLDEAIDLLRKRLEGSRTSLARTTEDLEFLRDQITTMEVNTARIHNWDVKRRRERYAFENIIEDLPQKMALLISRTFQSQTPAGRERRGKVGLIPEWKM